MVLVKGLESLNGVGEFTSINDAVVVGIQCVDDR